ncbi:cyclophilin-like fold protein [Gulosibacter sp. 10]|uniref:cyclophilin-like fold protein n=1 Tax=Gulosibacter sp. 10 TaxID=1255570 RepID=UPI00097F5729|nr:cyclophilin-like fold protein [Gulosibacter sp. 10]SJM49443.1 Conserved domain protein precursor [Gulosibacter sp. 10]
MADTPIRITLDGRTIDAVLHDNPAADALRAQLPLDLEFRDYARQEVLAELPERLTMEGMPHGCDPEIADIGYNHGNRVIVLHYSRIGFWPGTAVLGRLHVDASVLRGWDASKPARIELAD